MVTDFVGRTALITSAGRAIGRAVAIGLAAAGAAMRAWTRHQDPGRIRTTMHERFSQNFADSTLVTPGPSLAALIAHLGGDVATAPVRS